MTPMLTREPGSTARHPSAAGPEQGVIEEARRRQRLRRIRIALGGLLAAASIAGLAWALTAGGSPANRRLAHPPGGAAAAHGSASAAAGFNVRLSPALGGGQYGWCVAVEERPGAIAGGGCAATPVSSTPLAIDVSSGSLRMHRESIVLLTTPQVAAVLVNGRRRIPTLALPGLPYGLRAARILIPIRPIRVTSSPEGRPVFARPPEPVIVTLDARGHAIPNRSARGPAERTNHSARGPCALRASGLPGLAPQWSHLADAIRPFPGKLVGRAFFSCIDTEYYLQHWPLDAAILLDAANPGADTGRHTRPGTCIWSSRVLQRPGRLQRRTHRDPVWQRMARRGRRQQPRSTYRGPAPPHAHHQALGRPEPTGRSFDHPPRRSSADRHSPKLVIGARMQASFALHLTFRATAIRKGREGDVHPS